MIAIAPVSTSDVLAYAMKGAIVFFAVIVGFRLIGKRRAGSYNIFDIVTMMAAANAVQNAITGGRGNLAVGLVVSATILATGWFITRVFVRFPGAQRVLGEPIVILSQGKVRTLVLKRQGITLGELDTALRRHGLERIEQVALAVLEVDGDISIIPADNPA